MDYDKLRAEMNAVLDLMSKVAADSEDYKELTARLTELQAMEIKMRSLELDEAKSNEEASLRRREILAQEAETRQRGRSTVIESAARVGSTVLGVAGTIGAIVMTMFVEDSDIIRTKAFTFIGKILPKI